MSFFTGQDQTPNFAGQVLPDRTKSGHSFFGARIIVVLANILFPKYYKHLKKALTDKNGLVSGRLVCTLSKNQDK